MEILVCRRTVLIFSSLITCQWCHSCAYWQSCAFLSLSSEFRMLSPGEGRSGATLHLSDTGLLPHWLQWLNWDAALNNKQHQFETALYLHLGFARFTLPSADTDSWHSNRFSLGAWLTLLAHQLTLLDGVQAFVDHLFIYHFSRVQTADVPSVVPWGLSIQFFLRLRT